MKIIVLSLVSAFGIATACLEGGPAFAAEARLAWQDLDLTTAAGKAELDHRIEAAAQQICTSGPVTGSMLSRSATPRCLADAREAIAARIDTKVDHGQLAAIALARDR